MSVHRVEVFYIYPHEENTQFKEKKRMLDNHFSFIKRRNGVAWHNYEFQPGSNPTYEIKLLLNRADIILFLLSADYYATGGYEEEAEVALNRYRRGEARVIPIIFRPCDWKASEFRELVPLPQNGKGIFPGENEDEVCKEVQQGIDAVIDEWRIKQKVQQQIELADNSFKQEVAKGSFDQAVYKKILLMYYTALRELEKTYFSKDKADLLWKIGTVYAKYDQKELALRAYEQAIQLFDFHPMLPLFYKEQGEILLDLGQWEAAIKAYDMAIDLRGKFEIVDSDVAKMYENKGEAFIYLEKFEDALVAFDAAIEIDSGKFYLWQYRGEVCSKIEDIKELKRSYEEAIRLAPSNAYLHYKYGEALYKFQYYDEALNEYQRVLFLKPDFTQAYLNLHEVHAALAKQALEKYKLRKKDDK